MLLMEIEKHQVKDSFGKPERIHSDNEDAYLGRSCVIEIMGLGRYIAFYNVPLDRREAITRTLGKGKRK